MAKLNYTNLSDFYTAKLVRLESSPARLTLESLNGQITIYNTKNDLELFIGILPLILVASR